MNWQFVGEFGTPNALPRAGEECYWIAVFAYARGWAKWENNYERVGKLESLSARTWLILDEATSP